MGLRNLCGTGQSKGQHTCCTFIAEMIVHLYELSLHGKAGSQVDRVRAWRHELQLALSTSIACYRMNKLTSCHNISKWISGDLDSKCISSDFPVLNMAIWQCDVDTNGVGENKQKHTVQSVSLLRRNFCNFMNIPFQSHKNNRWMPPQEWATAKWDWEWGQISSCIHLVRHRTCV